MKQIDYVHEKRPLEFQIFPYKVKIFTIEKNKKFEYPDGESDVFCCMDIEVTNLLEADKISTSAHSSPGLTLIDTIGHQYENISWPRLGDSYEDDDGQLINPWAIDDGTSRFLFPLLDGDIWGGAKSRGWLLWSKIPEEAGIKRIILTVDASPDEAAKSPFAGTPGMSVIDHVAINVTH